MNAASTPAGPAIAAQHETRLHGRWLFLARAGWIATAVVTLGLNVAATPVAFHLLQTVCVASQCAQQINQLTPAQAHDLAPLGISLGFYALFVTAWGWLGTLIFSGIAAVVFWRRSDDRMALFAAFMLITFGVASGGWTSVLPGSNPAWTVPVTLIGIASQVVFYVFFCLFPSGRFVPGWLRWPALLYTVMWLLTLLPIAPLNTLVTGSSLPFFASIGILVFGQVYRFRRASTSLERQQTKWVVFGFTAGVGTFVALLSFRNFVLSPAAHHSGQGALFAITVIGLLLWLIPISIGIAILRSRLWDIDIIIRRTLVYGTLTALLAAIYFAGVVGTQALLNALTGQPKQQSPVVVVLTTLVIAALFTPLRRGIQAFIDRRFYRRKYDAAKTLARFGEALRSEVELEALCTYLLAAVEETMQPAHMSLWLRPTQQEVPR